MINKTEGMISSNKHENKMEILQSFFFLKSIFFYVCKKADSDEANT